MNIVVADDEVVIREMLSDALRDIGHQVHAASDGTEALQLIEANRPEVVISDIRMPNCSGLELLRQVQDMDDPPRVILVTGYADMNSVVEALRAGAYDYLAKPLRLEEIETRLRRLEREIELAEALETERLKSARLETAHQMIITLSHELNNPLTSVMGALSYIVEGGSKDDFPPEVWELLGKMENNCKRMADIMKRLREMEEVQSVPYIGNSRMVSVENPAAGKNTPDPT